MEAFLRPGRLLPATGAAGDTPRRSESVPARPGAEVRGRGRQSLETGSGGDQSGENAKQRLGVGKLGTASPKQPEKDNAAVVAVHGLEAEDETALEQVRGA